MFLFFSARDQTQDLLGKFSTSPVEPRYCVCRNSSRFLGKVTDIHHLEPELELSHQ